MNKLSNKETARNMFSGFFKIVPIGMILLFIWAVLALFGLDVGLDELTAQFLVWGLPVLFAIYWALFKYYDPNNP